MKCIGCGEDAGEGRTIWCESCHEMRLNTLIYPEVPSDWMTSASAVIAVINQQKYIDQVDKYIQEYFRIPPHLIDE